MLIDGLKLTLRNVKIIIFPIATLIIVYLLIIAAVFTVVPFSQLSQVYKSSGYSKNVTKTIEKFEKVVQTNMQKNVKKAIIVFLIFGLIAFFIGEFMNASFVVASRDIAINGHFSFKNAFDEGMVFTLPIIVVDILCSLGLLSAILPLYILYYVTGLDVVTLPVPLVVLMLTPILAMPRYVLVIKKGSAVDAVAEGIKVGLRNYPIALLVVLISASITLLSSFASVLLPILGAFSSSLLSVWLSQIVVHSYIHENAVISLKFH